MLLHSCLNISVNPSSLIHETLIFCLIQANIYQSKTVSASRMSLYHGDFTLRGLLSGAVYITA